MASIVKQLISEIQSASKLGNIVVSAVQTRLETGVPGSAGQKFVDITSPGISTTDALKIISDPAATPNEKQFALKKYKDAAILENIDPQLQQIEIGRAFREFESKSPVKEAIKADQAAEQAAREKFLPVAEELQTERSKIAQSALQAELQQTPTGQVSKKTLENVELFKLPEEETPEALRRRKMKQNKTPRTVT